MVRRLAALVFLVPMMPGCGHADRDRLQVIGRVICEPTVEEEKLDDEISKASFSVLDVHEMLRLTKAGIETGHPWVVCRAMSVTVHWLGEHADRRDAFIPLLYDCLKSTDPFTRMAAIFAADIIGERKAVRESLAQDSSFLLYRPDHARLWLLPWKEKQNTRRLLAASFVATRREQAVEIAGRLGSANTLPVLEAIANDPCEWYAETKDAARRSAKSLTDAMSDSGLGHGQPSR